MDIRLFDFIDKQNPKFNKLICEGLAVSHLKNVEDYVDKLVQSAGASFPAGLVYKGFVRCAPHEQFQKTTRKRGTKRQYEISRSDIFMVKYLFTYEGVDISPMYLYLPYVLDGGLINIKGATFSISPVLADHTISAGVSNLFIKLYKDKLTFTRSIYSFMINGNRTQTDIIISNIHHIARIAKNKKIPGFDATPVHYLFCKYGVKKSFQMFADAQVFVGTSAYINKDNFPPEHWSICNSNGIKPRGLRRDKNYIPTTIYLAIRNCDYNYQTAIMIGSFFYIIDHFPNTDPDSLENTDTWLIFLSYNATEEHLNLGKMLYAMRSHIESLDQYIDSLSRYDLAQAGINVTDIYQLFSYVINNMSTIIATAGNTVASMYEKKLSIMFYLLEDINYAISNMHFQLKKKSKGGERPLKIGDIEDKFVRIETIMSINGGRRSKHKEVSNISSATDNKIFIVTSNMRLQSEVVSISKSGDSVAIEDPMNFLHTSQAEVASFNQLTKKSITGRDSINMFVNVNPEGHIVRNPKYITLLDDIQENIKR